MKIIFGLGNPGRKYKFTRHNVGYEVIDRMETNLKLERNWLCSDNVIDNIQYKIIKPLCYVNESGIVAKEVVEYYKISTNEFLVILDDFSIPLGKIKMKKNGSSGGHKGLESIIYHLNTEEFPRIRIGIGPLVGDATNFVLSKFKLEEIPIITEVIEFVKEVIKVYVKEGIDKAMQLANSYKFER